MHHGILSFPCNVLFTNPFRHWLHSLSCGFMCFSNTTESCLCFRSFGYSCFWNTGFPNESIAAAFGTSDFRLAFWMMSQFSCIFEFRFLDCPFLFFSSLRGFSYLIQESGHMWSGRDVVWIFVSLLLDHVNRIGGVSFTSVSLVKAVHESNRFLFPSPIVIDSFFLSYVVWVDLMTSMYFSGIGNGSSLGTYNWTLGSICWR